MNSSPASPPSRRRSVEIHPMSLENDGGRPPSKPMRDHNNKRPPRPSFSRQVSLETGFSVLVDKAAAGKEDKEKAMLVRSGKSFGGFARGNGGRGTSDRSGEIRAGKGDFSIFRTKSAITKQNSLLPIKRELDGDDDGRPNQDVSPEKNVPTVGRYFAALRGPELDQIKESEDTLLPKDEVWPFLLRFPINCFGICLGLSSQAILWSALATSPATAFLHIPPTINLLLWLLAAISLAAVAAAYALKAALFFEAVRREYHHPVRVNFFFAPFIATMFLAIATPPSLLKNHRLHPAVWCVLMAPVAALELRIYGDWLSGGRRRLSKVANPSSHLSVVGNFVGAILAAKVGWVEPAKFFWAVGFAHYMVVFVTLYQRLPSSEALPKELHPVYSMFIAAPSAASIAWQGIYGDFDGLARTCYFIALFLYTSLVVRISFFFGFRFSVAWWSYTFPMTTVSIATIKYAENVPCSLSKGLVVTLSFMSSAMVSVLFVSTLLHAFVWQSLFPNDLAIAITKQRTMPSGREKKGGSSGKQSDIRRWAKQSPLSIVSSIAKNCHWDDKPDNKLKPDN